MEEIIKLQQTTLDMLKMLRDVLETTVQNHERLVESMKEIKKIIDEKNNVNTTGQSEHGE